MVQRKWKWLTSGHEPAFLEPRFPEAPLKLFSIFGVSEPLDRAQKRELRFHAERISKVVREKQPVIAKWRAYEKALDAVLRDEPIPEWEKVKAELESQQSAHNTSKTHHKRTLHMGKKVHEYRRKHGHDRGEGNPHLWQASKIRDWLRKDMINPDTGKPYSQGTLLKAAQETGCWVNTKQGSAAGLEESLDNLENYYLKHRQKSEKEV